MKPGQNTQVISALQGMPRSGSADARPRSDRIFSLLRAIVARSRLNVGAGPAAEMGPAVVDGDPLSADMLWGGARQALSDFGNDTLDRSDLDTLYTSLDNEIRHGGETDLLARPWVVHHLDELHAIRSQFEFDKELRLAKAIADSPDRGRQIERLAERERFWGFGHQLQAATVGSKRVMVAGSGPLPTTAFSFAKFADVDVCVVERDQEAFEIGRKILESSSVADRFEYRYADVRNITEFSGFETVFLAVLVGVGHRTFHASERSETIKKLLSAMPSGSALVTRDPNRLAWLLYPPLNLSGFEEHYIDMFLPKMDPSHELQCSVARIWA